FFASLLLLAGIAAARPAPAQSQASVSPTDEFPDPAKVVVRGVLGDAISASRQGRLSELPRWRNGELIAMFAPEIRDNHHKTDWYGEHAGKWLYTAAKAV